MLVIKAFDVRQIDAALVLWRDTEHLGLGDSDEPEALKRFLSRNPGFSFVAVEVGSDDDALVGSVLCGHDGRRGYLYHLAVSNSYRRQRLAGRLLGRSLARLEAVGIVKCHAFVFADNPYAGLFWERERWTRRDELLVYSKSVSSDVPE